MIGPLRTHITAGAVVTACAALSAHAQDTPREVPTVGTRAVPPFAIQNEAGEWEGLTIELWNSAAAAMRYDTNRMSNDNRTLRIRPREFESQQYAIALWQGSPLREELNRQILDRTADDWWQTVRQRYLASD